MISFSLVLFSISGIPPLAGFFSKLAILTSVISYQYYFTSITVVILSSIASFYYIRLIKTFFFVKTGKNTL
jgi:NADH-quinone oxidoreductase subunit N